MESHEGSTLILRVSRVRLAQRMLVMLVFLAGPAALLTTPPLGLKIIGGLTAVWAVFVLHDLAFRIMAPAQVIVVDRAGIEDLRSDLGRIGWQDIAAVYVSGQLGAESLWIRSCQPDVPVHRISLRGLSHSPSEVRHHVLAHHGALVEEMPLADTWPLQPLTSE